MADPKDNIDQKENLDIMREISRINKEDIKDSDEKRRISRAINSIQKEINSGLKDEDLKKKQILNIQKDISDIGNKILKEYKERKLTVDSLAKSLYKIRDLRREEKDLARQISIEDGLKVKSAELFNELGIGKSIKYLQDFNTLARENPWAAGLTIVTGLLHIFKEIFDAVDSSAADFRKEMGFLRSDTAKLEENVRDAYFSMVQTGVTAKDLYSSFQAIEKTIGTTQATTMGMAKDMALMSAQLGVAVGTSAEFATTMGMMGKSTMDAQRDMALFTSKLSAAAGTNLNEVMGDVAASAKSGYSFLTRNPLALAKAAVEAKRLGTSLVSAMTSAKALVDFTTSVNDEMAASVLLGESINLQRARELAYRRNIKGLNEEILNIATKAKFEELDPFQQDAVAKALGKSADEVGKMLQANREMMRIRSDPSLAKEVAAYDKLVSSTDAVAKSTADSARNNLMNLSNQKSLEAISLSLKSIYQTAFQPLVDLATWVLPKIATMLQAIHAHTNKWVSMFAGIFVIVGGLKILGKAVSFTFKGVGAAVGDFLRGTAKGVSAFGKGDVIRGAAGIFLVALALIPLAAAMKIAEGVSWKTVGIIAVSLIGLAAAAVVFAAASEVLLPGALVIAALGAALIPFAFAAWIASKALQSLSDVKLLDVAAGLVAIGAASLMLFPAAIFLPSLAFGFGALGLALRFAAGPIERVGKASMDLGNGLEKTAAALATIAGLNLLVVIGQFKNLASAISEISEGINSIPDIKIEKIQDIIVKATTIGAQQNDKSNDEMIKAIAEVRDAIMSLKSSFEKGGISANVQLDSQRLDSGMSRRLSFTGPLNGIG
jgi:hypothetical protein